ncbi:PREDICTED: uncharacterized protein C10orf120 homolog [Dipodomys ordii]|uniref:Uncharacterized protein C10orf120 homolog n=1 Tax=Dipodomys ordii TaxID=10020 RepID=A0A1S3FL94_DIPOR|nr:PREDICTED: uncharacterized protein C10orf120 homolog [Dipodomys ordii]
MLYVQVAIDRAMAEARLAEEKQQEATREAQVTLEDAQKECSRGLPHWLGPVLAPHSEPPMVTDSEWLGLSAQEQLAWAKNIQDPRIAVGSYSPLEKKIKCVGGVHSSDARKLLCREFKKEAGTVDKLKTVSFDSQSSKAETHYHQLQEMMTEQTWNQKTDPEWEMKIEEEKQSQSKKSEGDEKWDYLVSERELNHIQKHIYRAEHARGLRDNKYKLLPQKVPSEMLFPKITLYNEEKEKVQHLYKRETKKPKVAWAKEQINKHEERMIRGRKLTKQRNDERDAQKLSSYVPLLKPKVEKKVKEEFKRVTAYPLFQPNHKSHMEVTVLMKKSKEVKIQKTFQKEFLSIPPFLRCQLRKKKSTAWDTAQVGKCLPNKQRS